MALLRGTIDAIHREQRQQADADPPNADSIMRKYPIIVLLTHFGAGCQLYSDISGITHMFLRTIDPVTMQQWVERVNGQKRTSWHASVKSLRVVVPSSMHANVAGNAPPRLFTLLCICM